MATGLLTPASTGDAPPPQAPARPAPSPIPAQQPTNTLSMNSPLAGMAAPTAGATPPIHSNEAINAALMNAFRPIVPDAVNGLFGNVLAQVANSPISYYQPRPAPQIATRRGS